ncbi:MAG: tetratricopeptide repeat protein [Burkholderiales bacterium]|nr:tetratricopeptide repeat protein [Burkholderiales bacterium]
MRYADTLRLVERLPERRPAPTLPSRLDALFERLAACPSEAEARPVEDEIWAAWMYDGHEEAEAALDRAASDLAARRFDIAETRLVRLARARPRWAEAWNKLATLYYMTERDDESVAAIRRTLELEPRHFGALAGLGEILRAHGERESALLAFRRALRLNPHLADVRATLRALGADA